MSHFQGQQARKETNWWLFSSVDGICLELTSHTLHMNNYLLSQYKKLLEGKCGMTGTIIAIMALSIPIIAIVSKYLESQTQTKSNMLKDELELEKLKHENYVSETQLLRLQLEQRNLEDSKDEKRLS